MKEYNLDARVAGVAVGEDAQLARHCLRRAGFSRRQVRQLADSDATTETVTDFRHYKRKSHLAAAQTRARFVRRLRRLSAALEEPAVPA